MEFVGYRPTVHYRPSGKSWDSHRTLLLIINFGSELSVIRKAQRGNKGSELLIHWKHQGAHSSPERRSFGDHRFVRTALT